ncbi:MAG TPA: CDP-alcohol phosphatidyltransferase family protein [Polyangia bacterium]|nr:CDP-alcohol phosphatidyltransferase family protein [Polyangia bacterium]
MTWDGDLIYLLGFIAFFATPFLAYLVLLFRGAVHLAPAKPKASGRRLFGPVFVGYYYWLMRPLFSLALRSGISPNQVTLATLIVAVAASVSIGMGHFELASGLLIAGGSLDILDGHLARLKKMATSQGAFLDSTVDRICDGLVFGGCVVYYARTPMILVCLAVLIMSFTVSYARGRAEALGVSGAEGLMQRADRLTVLGIALAFSPFFAHRSEGHVAHPIYAITAVSLCLLAVLSTVTAISRILWTLKELGRKQTALPLDDLRTRTEPSALTLTSLRPTQTSHILTTHKPAVGSHR